MANQGSDTSAGKRLLLFLVPAALFVGVLGVATLSKAGPPKPGDAAPAFEATLLEGDGSLALADLRGKPVVLNFWASWCAPCKDEAPLLKRAHEEYGDRVAFVGVNIKDARDDALAFDAEYGLEYPDVRDERGQLFSDYGLTGQPETFFIDADGMIVEHVNGPVFAGSLDQLLQELVTADG